MQFLRRIYYLLHRNRMERELQNDIEAHREMMSAEGRNDFGNPTLIRERSHEAWGWSWLDRLFQDLRFGARLLRKSPALAVTAICVLALGIGVNVTAFNIIDVMSFKPLHVRDPHSLVRFTSQSPTMSYGAVSYPAVMFYRENNTALSAMLAQTKTQMTFGDSASEGVEAGFVTANYFSELGASAAYGRLFDPASDGLPAAPAVVVLGYGFWQSRFGGDPSAIGRTIRLNQRPVTVVGVTAFDFTGLDPEAGEKNSVWLLLEKQAYFVPETKLFTSFDIGESGVSAFGRLKPGITRRAAQEALRPVAQTLEQQHPDALSKGEHLVAHPGGIGEEINVNDLPEYGFLAALVLLVLTAACGNLGNLLLGQAVAREREISIRMALGAGRGRIIRQLMTESALLALVGSAAGLVLGWFVSRAVVVTLGGPRNMDFSPDWRTVVFALGIGMLACFLFGLPAARQASNKARRPGRMRTIFMAAQVGASCVLIVVSALLVRSLYRAYNSDPGFEYSRVITIDSQLYAHGYSAEKAAQYMRELESRLEQIPGVQSVSLAWVAPLGNHVSMRPAGGDIKVNIHHNNISSRLFQTLAIPMLRGRDFAQNDKDVAIVSESCARNLWPGKDALQQTYTLGKRKLPVIGVVGNARMTAMRNGDDAVVYMPLDESKINSATMLVRTSQPPATLLATVSSVSRAVDPTLSPNVQLLKDAFNDKLSDSGKITAVISGLGILALLLAVIGLYGVVAYSVAQRTKEIGIRVALGATPSLIVQAVVSGFLRLLIVSLIAGLALAALLSVVLRQFLYGLSNFDSVSYIGAAVLLLVAGSLGTLIPARRALKVDPMAALRCE